MRHLIPKEIILIASIGTYASSYFISITSNHIILNACIRLTTIEHRLYKC